MQTRLLSIIRRTKMVIFFGALVTYPICVLDTWRQPSSVAWKLFLNVTADALSAILWPATWLTWLILKVAGYGTPISSILGL